MRKTKKISVLGKNIPLILENLDEDEGRFDSQKNIIYIDPKYPMSRKTNTLAHEILHATFEYSGLGHLFSEGQEEAIVRCIEYNFFKYLDHNKLKTILAEAELVSDDITKPKK